MNWRRGFLRLWLVASVIWIAGNAVVFQLPGNLIEVTPWLRPADPAGWWLKDPLAVEPLPPPVAREGPQPPPAVFVPLPPGAVLDPPTTQSEGPWTKYQVEARRRDAIASLWGFVFFGLGPPLAALCLGIAIMWVLRGFRRTNP